MIPPLQLTGIGLRPQHYHEIATHKPPLAWLEARTETHFGEGGQPLHILEILQDHYPIGFHGAGMSLGSSDELNWLHLKKCRDLFNYINPCLISEHLGWSSLNGYHYHAQFPLSYTKKSLDHLRDRIDQVQNYLHRQIIIENISRYITYTSSTMSEAEFLSELAKSSGCGILLDINSIYITACNLNVDPYDYIRCIPSELVHQIHLSGHEPLILNEENILIDSHNNPISNAVWDLYQFTILQLGCKPTIIEWDENLPSLSGLCQEALKAEHIMRQHYARTKRAS